MSFDKLHTINEVADQRLLPYSARHLRRLIANGEIQCIRISPRKMMISDSAIWSYVGRGQIYETK